jgi:DNA-binding response OmpR family regulator
MMLSLEEVEDTILHILVVEKQSVIGLHVSRCLEREAFKVFVLNNFEKEKQELKVFSPDYLIIDDKSLQMIGNELLTIKKDMKIIALIDTDPNYLVLNTFKLSKLFYKPFNAEDIVSYLIGELK